MIVPFWSWNLSDTTHVRSHTKFQLIWAINTAFTRGGLNQPPPLTQMCSWDPLTIRVKVFLFDGAPVNVFLISAIFFPYIAIFFWILIMIIGNW